MPKRIPPFSQRILSRLSAAESHEPNPWLRDDIEIARLILAHAARGDAVCCSPHVLASYEVLGLHPEKVWPAIQERRKALLGPLEVSDAPPKKPAQSVKLWPEKTNGARAVNSCAGITILGEPANSVPMAAPSITAAYTNSPRSNSEKFEIVAAVRSSTLAERHRNLVVSMLFKNQFGDELWMETNHIAAVMGRVCNRRKPGMITRTVNGKQQSMMLGPCKKASRRTVQRLIDDLVYCRDCGKSRSRHSGDHEFVPRVEGGGLLDELYEPNSYVPYGGGKKFRPSATYRICRERLTPRQTSGEYVEERERNRKRKLSQRVVEIAHESAEVTPIRKPAAPAPPPLPPAPAAPLPKKEQPAAEYRGEGRRISRDERAALARIYVTLRKGGISHAPAVAQACSELKLPIEAGEVALKIALAKKAEQEERDENSTCRSAATDRVSRNRESLSRAARDHVAGRAGPDGAVGVSSAESAEPSTELFPDRQRSRLRRRMQAILRQWDRGKEASVGASGSGLTFLSLVRQACDDELIDFGLAWPFVEKLWWHNEQGWRKVMKLGQPESGA